MDFEVITEEGTILKGVIYSKNMSLNNICSLLKNEFNLDNNKLFINKEKNRVELDILFLQKIQF